MAEPLHDGLLALLGAAVGASVFAVGFASVRHHAALRDARGHARLVRRWKAEPGVDVDMAEERSHLALLVEDLATFAAMVASTALAVVVVVAVALGMHNGIGNEGYGTLILFLVVELIVVALGWLDRRTTIKRIPRALAADATRRLESTG
jgi:hypothetical protein